MALKNTKAIPAPLIKKPSEKKDLVGGTAKASPASKNTSAKGLKAEQLVIGYAQDRGFEVLKQRWVTPFAEVDLLLKKQEILYLVEVKHRNTTADFQTVISKTQLQRLKRALVWVAESLGPTQFILVVVSQEGEISWMEDVFG